MVQEDAQTYSTTLEKNENLPKSSVILINPRALIAVALGAATLSLQSQASGPDKAIVALVRAMYAADGKSFAALTLPDPGIGVLTRDGSVNQDGLRELDEDPHGVQIITKRAPEYRGTLARLDATGKYPVGTTALYVVAHHRSPLVMVVQMTPGRWKVDPRWWIAMVGLASTDGPKEGTPAYAAQRLISAMIAGDRDEARRIATPGANMDLLFSGAPRQREPSGELDAAAAVMPVVEMKPGEFRRLPTGQIVEASSRPDVKLLVGLFGPIEIPFVVRQIGGSWRVEPQPYFILIES